jgi:4-hydroxy-tetrahydrodipicolinate reductase
MSANRLELNNMSSELSVAIFGISGRMGISLITAMEELPHLKLVGATASAQSEWIGRDVTRLGSKHSATITADPAVAIERADVVIDFTLPEATVANLSACVATRCPLVIGTTGLDERVRAQIDSAAEQIGIVVAPNMSLGVNLLLRLVELAAQKLDDTYDLEVFEAHHRHKKDAPSGTARALAGAAAKGRGVRLEEVAEYQRVGPNVPRRSGTIGFSVFRGGDVVGDHTVTFAGLGERVELTHRATDRLAFARGAVRAAQWLAGRAPGLYSMQDVLGLKA